MRKWVRREPSVGTDGRKAQVILEGMIDSLVPQWKVPSRFGNRFEKKEVARRSGEEEGTTAEPC